MPTNAPVVTATTHLDDATVVMFRSTVDGALVVQVDTAADQGRTRVYVNDAQIWDADPETHHHSFCECTRR